MHASHKLNDHFQNVPVRSFTFACLLAAEQGDRIREDIDILRVPRVASPSDLDHLIRADRVEVVHAHTAGRAIDAKDGALAVFAGADSGASCKF